jgi:hypothetical protein
MISTMLADEAQAERNIFDGDDFAVNTKVCVGCAAEPNHWTDPQKNLFKNGEPAEASIWRLLRGGARGRSTFGEGSTRISIRFTSNFSYKSSALAISRLF